MIQTSAFLIAQRFIGTKEVPGATANNPQIMAMLRLDDTWPQSDEVPWCSGFVNYVAWLLRLPRSKRLDAKSWLNVGIPITLAEAKPDCDVIVLSKIDNPAEAAHVGFFASVQGDLVYLLGGNQSDNVTVAPFAASRVMGVRRLA